MLMLLMCRPLSWCQVWWNGLINWLNYSCGSVWATLPWLPEIILASLAVLIKLYSSVSPTIQNIRQYLVWLLLLWWCLWRSIRSWLRYLGFSHIWRLIQDKWQKIGQPKNWPKNLYQIFIVWRGHKVGHNDTVLRGFDEGILRGGGGKKNFWPPISPPLGVRER